MFHLCLRMFGDGRRGLEIDVGAIVRRMATS
jgi:hypothetical protein